MHSNIYNYFLANKVDEFNARDEDFKLISDFKKLIDDQPYYQFIVDSQNGGFFFENSLHLYGFAANPSFHDIQPVNSLLQKEYGDVAKSLISFGQDLFGNQFFFDTNSKSIVMFDSEIGERKKLLLIFTTG